MKPFTGAESASRELKGGVELWKNAESSVLFRPFTTGAMESGGRQKEGMSYQADLEAAFENTGGMVFLVEEDLTISMVNSTLLETTGWKREEIVGRKVTELVHPDDLPMVLERHRARLQGEEVPPGYEIRYLTKDGRVRWGFVTATLIPQTRQTLVSGVDITEAREARQLLEAVFLGAPVEIFIAQENRFKMVNP